MTGQMMISSHRKKEKIKKERKGRKAVHAMIQMTVMTIRPLKASHLRRKKTSARKDAKAMIQATSPVLMTMTILLRRTKRRVIKVKNHEVEITLTRLTRIVMMIAGYAPKSQRARRKGNVKALHLMKSLIRIVGRVLESLGKAN